MDCYALKNLLKSLRSTFCCWTLIRRNVSSCSFLFVAVICVAASCAASSASFAAVFDITASSIAVFAALGFCCCCYYRSHCDCFGCKFIAQGILSRVVSCVVLLLGVPAIASALAAHRLLREFARRGRSSSSNSSSNSNSSRRGNSNSSSSSLRLSVGVGEEFTVAGEVACSRLGTARRQQQRLQQLLQADAETLQQTLQTKRDWEALAGEFQSLVAPQPI